MAIDPEDTDMFQVGNFLIDQGTVLGEGNFGKVYLAQEIPDDFDTSGMVQGDESMSMTMNNSRMNATNND